MAFDTIFYICGGILAAIAVITSFIGLRSERFPGRATPVVILAFVALVGVTTTYAVLNGQEEEEHRAQELEEANAEVEELEGESAGEAGAAGGGELGASAGGEKTPINGPGGTLQLAASESEIAFDTTELSSEPGQVTIELTNPAALEHNVAIEKEGKVIAVSETISEGKTSVSAPLSSGSYTFLCTVPGHAEAGMQGTLTVR